MSDVTPFRFGMSIEQTKQFLAWRDDPEQHGKCRAMEKRTAIGGAFSFAFTPTTLGTGVSASCCVCKASINLSDYENW